MPGDTTTTDLTPAQVIGQLQARQGATLRSVMSAIAVMTAKNKGIAQAKPPVAVEPTEDEIKSLGALAAAVQTTAFPTEVRALEPAEIARLTELRAKIIDPVQGMINRTKEAIRESMFNHFDAKADVGPLTFVDAKGHAVLPDSESGRVEGCEDKLVREVKRGGMSFGPSITLGDNLKTLEDQGVITHAQYLRWTRQVRALDETTLFEDAKKDEALYKVIEAITKVENPSASLNVRKNQDETT